MHLSGCSKQFNFSFLFVFKRTKNVNAFSPWNPSGAAVLDTLLLLHGHCFKWTPGACVLFPSSCFPALCYLAQQQVVSDSRYCTLRFSPTHLCLYSGACSQLFMIKHCSNSQVKIYWHKGGWEEGVAGWSSVSTSSWWWCYWCCPRVCAMAVVPHRGCCPKTPARDWSLSAQPSSLCVTQ